HRTGVLARGTDAGEDRVRVLGIERQELDHVLLRAAAVAALELLRIARRVHQRLPLLRRTDRQVEHPVQIHIDEARHVFGAFDIAAHPIDRIGNTTQHYHCAPTAEVCWDCACPSSGTLSSSREGSSASTHVSLLPPPCDELTTSEPSLSATRVRP